MLAESYCRSYVGFTWDVGLIPTHPTCLTRLDICMHLSLRACTHAQVLEAFTATFEFSGLNFDAGLRIFLEAFRLPGEAQKIDRIINAFGRAYFSTSPDVFAHEDAAYVLAYSVIMLNTDRHNSQVRNDKPLVMPMCHPCMIISAESTANVCMLMHDHPSSTAVVLCSTCLNRWRCSVVVVMPVHIYLTPATHT